MKEDETLSAKSTRGAAPAGGRSEKGAALEAGQEEARRPGGARAEPRGLFRAGRILCAVTGHTCPCALVQTVTCTTARVGLDVNADLRCL